STSSRRDIVKRGWQAVDKDYAVRIVRSKIGVIDDVGECISRADTSRGQEAQAQVDAIKNGASQIVAVHAAVTVIVNEIVAGARTREVGWQYGTVFGRAC